MLGLVKCRKVSVGDSPGEFGNYHIFQANGDVNSLNWQGNVLRQKCSAIEDDVFEMVMPLDKLATYLVKKKYFK